MDVGNIFLHTLLVRVTNNRQVSKAIFSGFLDQCIIMKAAKSRNQ
jgi:hypothetical protein